MRFTVFGSSGFIGSHARDKLVSSGFECLTPLRGDSIISAENLGHVIYCVGLTADFRERPFDTVRAHVSYLADILKQAKFESFLYLSSTRVYQGSKSTVEEATLTVRSHKSGDLYNLSKLLGESLCLSSGKQNVRIVRLSNVYGAGDSSINFLPSIIRDACQSGEVVLNTTLSSTKDYIAVSDVVGLLPIISLSGKQTIYNVASGTNVSNRAISNTLKECCKCTVSVAKGSPEVRFPRINIERIQHEFGFVATSLLANFPHLVQSLRTVPL